MAGHDRRSRPSDGAASAVPEALCPALSGDQELATVWSVPAWSACWPRVARSTWRRAKVALYRTLELTLVRAAAPSYDDGAQTVENGEIVAQSVARLGGPRRQILLLATLEGFAAPQIATIMGRSEDEVRREFAAGKQELREQPATRILIIEDEPVIALDISHTVEASGHTVTGIATTHRQAVELAQAEPPGLVLADIHLGDDSSGIEAVAEILEHYRVPVIFITAFPDRLLTGERPDRRS